MPDLTSYSTSDGGFWRLLHDDLSAFLARADLCSERTRVYLALADLTLGYGKERDTVSLSQIAERAGMYDGTKSLDTSHVCRALKELGKLGLVGSAPGKGQDKTRWVTWPTPSLPTTAETGSRTTTKVGNGTTAKVGKHQEIKKYKKGAAAPPVSEKNSESKSSADHRGNGAGGRVVALWVQEFKKATGRDFSQSARGKTAGTLKRLLSDHGEETLSAAVGRWFGAKRTDYGIELFNSRLNGGSSELLPPRMQEPSARELQDIENTRKLMEGSL